MKEKLEEAIKKYCLQKYGNGYYPDVEKGIEFGAKWQQKNSYSEKDLKDLLDWLTNEKSEFSIMYGNQDKRFSSNDKDYTIDEFLEIYKQTL
jgi:hypothetical protein